MMTLNLWWALGKWRQDHPCSASPRTLGKLWSATDTQEPRALPHPESSSIVEVFWHTTTDVQMSDILFDLLPDIFIPFYDFFSQIL